MSEKGIYNSKKINSDQNLRKKESSESTFSQNGKKTLGNFFHEDEISNGDSNEKAMPIRPNLEVNF